MKVSGFTIVRNAIKYDYPVVESIKSILPLCDEIIVAVGESEDGTLQLIMDINDPRIKIIQTVWNDNLREGGKVLALETDKALAAVDPKSTWCFYIQADEVIHEKYHQEIRDSMKKWASEPSVEGLLFNYMHFYGSYDYVADSRKWYKKEIRIVRNNIQVKSYRDAQGFRINGTRKLNVKPIDVYVYHYGWVKPPEAQQAKQKSFHRMWHDEAWMKQNIPDTEEFDYTNIDSLALFRDNHPETMRKRISARNWKFNFDPEKKTWSVKMKVLMWIEKTIGWRIGEYKNYKVL